MTSVNSCSTGAILAFVYINLSYISLFSKYHTKLQKVNSANKTNLIKH